MCRSSSQSELSVCKSLEQILIPLASMRKCHPRAFVLEGQCTMSLVDGPICPLWSTLRVSSASCHMGRGSTQFGVRSPLHAPCDHAEVCLFCCPRSAVDRRRPCPLVRPSTTTATSVSVWQLQRLTLCSSILRRGKTMTLID